MERRVTPSPSLIHVATRDMSRRDETVAVSADSDALSDNTTAFLKERARWSCAPQSGRRTIRHANMHRAEGNLLASYPSEAGLPGLYVITRCRFSEEGVTCKHNQTGTARNTVQMHGIDPLLTLGGIHSLIRIS